MLERVLGEGAVWEEAVDTLVDASYRDWLKGTADDPSIVVIGRPSIDLVEAEEGKPLRYTAKVPLRPEVKLGDYANFPFKPEIDAVDDAKVERVVDELRDQQATLGPVEERPAAKGDWAVIGFVAARWATSRTWRPCARRSANGWSAARSTEPATGSPTGSSNTPSRTPRSRSPTSSSTRRSR